MGITGTYLDPKVNHKDVDYNIAKHRKNKLGVKTIIRSGVVYTINKRALTKKYADGHQKLKK